MSSAATPCPTAGHRLAAVRAFGVVFGGSMVLDAAAIGALVAGARALRRRCAPSAPALLGMAGIGLYWTRLHPWMERWGLARDERPGHAVEIDAPPERVWPWLAQIGQDRGGFYSYEWLENLAGCRIRNAEEIHPEWQHRQPGETVMLHPAHGMPVARFEPGRAMALEGWGSFALEPLPGGQTRLIARGEPSRGARRLFSVLLVEVPHFVMERRMLLSIKERAERAVA